MFDNIFNFYSEGNGYLPCVIALGAVSYVFGVTLLSSACDVGLRRAKKTFFIYLCAFAWVITAASCALNYISGYTSLFEGVTVCAFSTCALFIQFGILWVESKILVGPTKAERERAEKMIKEAADEAVGFWRDSIDSPFKKPVKREIKGVICEIPLRKTERVPMQTASGDEVLSESYIKDCIAKLKETDLSIEDKEGLTSIERDFTFPIKSDSGEDKRKLCESGGKIITLMSKYFSA